MNWTTLFLLLLMSTGFSQQPKVVIQSGHSATINDAKISKDGNYLISCSNDKMIIVWDRISQKQFRVLKGHTKEVVSIVLDPESSTYFYSCGRDGKVFKWNIITGEQTLALDYQADFRKMIYHPITKQYTMASTGIFVFDRNFKLLNSYGFQNAISSFFFDIGIINNFDINSQGTKCVVSDGMKTAVVFDFEDKGNNYSMQKKPMLDVIFSPSGNKIVQSYVGGGIRISDPYSIGTFKFIGSLDFGNKPHLAKEKNNIYAATENGNILKLNSKLALVLSSKKIHDVEITSLQINTLHNIIITADISGKITLSDLKTLQPIESYQAKINRISDITFSDDGKTLFTVFQNGQIKSFNLETFEFHTCNAFLTKKSSKRRKKEVVDIQFENGTIIINYVKKQVSTEVKSKYDYIHQYVASWDYKNDKLTQNKRVKNGSIENLYSQGEITQGAIIRGDNSPLYDINRNLSIKNTNLTLNKVSNVFTNPEYQQFNFQHDDEVSSIYRNPIGDFIASSSWDGSIKFWDYKSGHLINKLYLFDNDQFIIFNNDNQYFSSKNGIRNIGFRLQNELFSFEQFDLIYNRPDQVFKSLSALLDSSTIDNYKLAYNKRITRLGLSEKDITAIKKVPKYQFVISTVNDNIATVNCSSLEHSSSYRLNIFINGVPLYGASGLLLKTNKLDTTFSIHLEPGNNRIQSYLTNKSGIKSLIREQVIKTNLKTELPNLYLVTIGCSKYEEDDFNLNYAAKDALDVANKLKQSASYKNINTLSFTDKQVDKKMLTNIKHFIHTATPSDIVILFAAGHGVLSEKLDFYYATADIDFLHPEKKGIAYSEFENLLENCTSRHKCLILDACHSGEIDKKDAKLSEMASVEEGDIHFRTVGNNIESSGQNTLQLSKHLFADMRTNNGINIISSAGGAEYAMEGDIWNNGVFTFMLLKGLENNNADYNGDKEVSLNELKKYVLEGVVLLTNGAQNPTSRIENLYNDYTIFK